MRVISKAKASKTENYNLVTRTWRAASAKVIGYYSQKLEIRMRLLKIQLPGGNR